jgi:hypothetical protein
VKDKLLEFAALEPTDLGYKDITAFLAYLGNLCPGTANSLQVVVTYEMPGSLATQDLVDVLTFTTGVEGNDAAFQTKFPFVQKPWNGFFDGAMCDENGNPIINTASIAPYVAPAGLNMAAPKVQLQQIESFPNPARESTTFRYRVATPSDVSLQIFDDSGKLVNTPVLNQPRAAGVYEVPVNVSKLKSGIYYVRVQSGNSQQTLKFVVKQ